MAAVLAEVAEEKAELEESVLVLGRKVATLEGGTLNAPPPLSFIAGAMVVVAWWLSFCFS